MIYHLRIVNEMFFSLESAETMDRIIISCRIPRTTAGLLWIRDFVDGMPQGSAYTLGRADRHFTPRQVSTLLGNSLWGSSANHLRFEKILAGGSTKGGL